MRHRSSARGGPVGRPMDSPPGLARRLGAGFVAALVLCLCMPVTALAWGRLGHAIVGAIADETVSEATREQIVRLLADDMDAHGRASHRTTLAEVASWPDEIRALPGGRATARWHYQNLPLCGDATPSTACEDGECISVALARQIGILSDRSEPTRARNEALKWVVHLVGDIHQPLHAADHGDYGGSRLLVTYKGRDSLDGKPLSLHALWDTIWVREAVAGAGGRAAFIAAKPSDTVLATWREGSIGDWLMESHSLALSAGYAVLGEAFSCGRMTDSRIAIADSAEDIAVPVVRLRLWQAGIRLADVLDAALGPNSAAHQ